MTSYLLIEIVDEDIVEQTIEGLKDYHETVKLVGVYRKPTKFCECTDRTRADITTGKKYGWNVCRKCGKPPYLAYQTPRNLLIDYTIHQTEAERLIFDRGWWHPENATWKQIQHSYNDRAFEKPRFGLDFFNRPVVDKNV
jgi:hypothetical protein